LASAEAALAAGPLGGVDPAAVGPFVPTRWPTAAAGDDDAVEGKRRRRRSSQNVAAVVDGEVDDWAPPQCHFAFAAVVVAGQ
jgi:hypothetical protein